MSRDNELDSHLQATRGGLRVELRSHNLSHQKSRFDERKSSGSFFSDGEFNWRCILFITISNVCGFTFLCSSCLDVFADIVQQTRCKRQRVSSFIHLLFLLGLLFVIDVLL